MKAGRTSSNLGGDTTIRPMTSAALKQLTDEIGSSSFYLNTIVVGLDAVESGHEKPATLDIFWEPKNRQDAARMARKFAVEAFMVRAAEALSAYVKVIGILPRFQKIKETWDQDTGASEKLEQIANNLVSKESYLTAGGMLLITWRNRIVHEGKLTLPHHRKQILRKNAVTISENYRNLSVDLLLDHAENQRPTLKDASCLIAMAINLAREMDEKVYSNLGKEDVFAIICHYGLDAGIRKILGGTTDLKIPSSIERLFQTHAPGLYSEFIRFFDPSGKEFLDN